MQKVVELFNNNALLRSTLMQPRVTTMMLGRKSLSYLMAMMAKTTPIKIAVVKKKKKVELWL